MSKPISDTYVEEAQELLAELEEALLDLEKEPGNMQLIGKAFRSLHNLKGAGDMAGYDQVADFVHELEAIFELLRAGQIEASAHLINLSLTAKDQLVRMITGSEESAGDVESRKELLTALHQIVPQASPQHPEEQGGAKNDATDEKIYRIRFRPPEKLFQRGLNPEGLIFELERLGRLRSVAQTEGVPELDVIDPEHCYLYWDFILVSSCDENAIHDVFIFVEDECELSIERIDENGNFDPENDYLRLGKILIERGDLERHELAQVLTDTLGDGNNKNFRQMLLEKQLVSAAHIDSAVAEQQEVRSFRQAREATSMGSGIRVRSEKLDTLVNLVGELVTVQARLSQTALGEQNIEMTAIAEEVERLTWEMRDQILTIRMLPIGTTYARFRRLVHDLAGELDKEVELITTGAETELDKTVIDRLGDPLVHLIRNALDHGIESAQERVAAGKARRGRIFLSATHSGAHVIITIRDDGAGLKRESIRQRAEELGLLAAGAELNERDLLAMIFAPGFSTVAEVTNVSGRGVGMDVVKQAIDSLRGTIELESEVGVGTTFTVKLPLTLAIIDGLLVKVENETYVLPLSMVEECIELKREDAEKGNGRALVQVRDEIVPYLRLRERFEIAGQPPAIEQVVIAETAGRRVGFCVDQVIGEHQTVIKPLGRMYREVIGLSGATILGDGTVALILDLPRLTDEALEEERLLNEKP